MKAWIKVTGIVAFQRKTLPESLSQWFHFILHLYLLIFLILQDKNLRLVFGNVEGCVFFEESGTWKYIWDWSSSVTFKTRSLSPQLLPICEECFSENSTRHLRLKYPSSSHRMLVDSDCKNQGLKLVFIHFRNTQQELLFSHGRPLWSVRV